MIRFEVFRIPTSVLRFNFNNTRIRAELEGIMHDNGVNLNPDSAEQQSSVEKILLESKSIGEMETQKLREDLERRGQLDPVISTADGVLIDGNRRLAIFRSLAREDATKKDFSEMDVSVLPADATTDDLKELEMRIQMSHNFRLQYLSINAALEFRDLHRNLGWTLERIEELTLRQFRKTVIEDMIEIVDLIDEYLNAIPPQGKYAKHYSLLKKGWESFHNLHYTLGYWERRSVSGEELERFKLFGFAIIHHEKSTYYEIRNFNKILKDKFALEKLKSDSDILKGRRLDRSLEPKRVQQEYENLQAAKEILKDSQEDPKKSLRIILRRMNTIKASRLTGADAELRALIKSIKRKIESMEERVGK